MEEIMSETCETCNMVRRQVPGFKFFYHTVIDGKPVCPATRDAPARSRTIYVHNMLTKAYQNLGKPYPFRAEWEACQQTPEYADYVRRREERRDERGRGGGKGQPLPNDTQTIEVATVPTNNVRQNMPPLPD